MTSAPLTSLELNNFGECNSCGERIGWIEVLPNRRHQPVDPEPNIDGQYALCMDGRTAIWLQHALVVHRYGNAVVKRFRAAETDGAWPLVRYIDHQLTCTPKGVRTLRSSARAVRSGRGLDDQLRELRRKALLRSRPNR